MSSMVIAPDVQPGQSYRRANIEEAGLAAAQGKAARAQSHWRRRLNGITKYMVDNSEKLVDVLA
ncbi:hypothetical protein ACQPXH_12180 [Nocardia sp. CA-135953]|uniref:hypothetical protein n=1 Tax=Nocardia sp. CA-135953 TaxID=3239978 RepID=UPI003D950C51